MRQLRMCVLLGAALLIGGRAAYPAQGAPSSQPASAASAAPAAEPAGPAAPETIPGQLDLVVRHSLLGGRILVRLGGRAFLNAPLTLDPKAPLAPFQRPLSVPSGRQPVEISLLDQKGRLLARGRTEGVVPAEKAAVLDVVEHLGEGEGLTLTWRTP